MHPNFTLNYGLRWEFSGAPYSHTGAVHFPDEANLLGPSTALFQPGVLNGVAQPTLTRGSNAGADRLGQSGAERAASPGRRTSSAGCWRGSSAKGPRSVIRGGYALVYYDEGTLMFSATAGDNPGQSQSFDLQPGFPGFTPGGLTLQSQLPPFVVFPRQYQDVFNQSDFTFGNTSFATMKGDLRDAVRAVLEHRRAARADEEHGARSAVSREQGEQRVAHLQPERGEHLRERLPAGVQERAAEPGDQSGGGRGQLPEPRAARPGGAADVRGGVRRARIAAGAARRIGLHQRRLHHRAAAGHGRIARQRAGDQLDVHLPDGGRRVLPLREPGLQRARAVSHERLPGESVRRRRQHALELVDDASYSNYHAMQLQLRRRYAGGLTASVNYTLAKNTGDIWADNATQTVNYRTLRDRSLDKGPTPFDVRHAVQMFGTYELPFGKDRRVGISNRVLDAIAGGWVLGGILTAQSGSPFRLSSGRQTVNAGDGGVVLMNGLTVKDLQKMIKVSPGPGFARYWIDPKLIGPDGRANPQYLAPPTTPGEFGQFVYLRGPNIWNVDASLNKSFRVTNDVKFTLHITATNLLNHPVWALGPAVSGVGLNFLQGREHHQHHVRPVPPAAEQRQRPPAVRPRARSASDRNPLLKHTRAAGIPCEIPAALAALSGERGSIALGQLRRRVQNRA